MSNQPITRGEVRKIILKTKGRSFDNFALASRNARKDAVGRISHTDLDTFQEVIAKMLADGELSKCGPFLRLM